MKKNSLELLITLVLGASITIFAQIYSWGHIYDPDVFYHARISSMLWHGISYRPFLWNQFSILSNNYIDHHWLFHWLMAPFMGAGELLGTSLFLVAQTLGLIVIVWVLLGTWKVTGRSIWALGLLLMFSKFFVALNTGRGQILSVAFLCLGLICFTRRKWLSLGLVMCLYVLAYDAFPLLLVFAGIWTGILSISEKRFAWKPITTAILGCILGIVLHPDFPQNLNFYWIHIVQIGLLPHPIQLGNGWMPYGTLAQFLRYETTNSLLFVLILFLAYRQKKLLGPMDVFILLITIIFFAATIKSRQFGIYWAPFTILSLSLLCRQYLPIFKTNLRTLWRTWQLKIGILVFCLVVLSGCVFQVRQGMEELWSGTNPYRYKGASEWLKNNSEPGDIVYNTDWDQFPQLFFWNQKNYYIVGLDPLFLYTYDKSLYEDWTNTNLGRLPLDRVYTSIHSTFNARYVFTENYGFPLLVNQMAKDIAHFKLVYQDEYTQIYKIH